MPLLKKLIFIIIVLVFSFEKIFAQAPGYLGKKTSVGYGFFFSPSFIGANPNDKFWNKIHEIYIARATAPKWEVGLNTRFYKTIYDNKRELSKEHVSPSNYYSINGLSIAMNFKHFRHNYVSPWGGYFSFGPVLHLVAASYDPYMHMVVRVNGHDTLDSGFGPERQLFIMGDVMFGWGKTRVIKDRVLFDYGVSGQILSLIGTLSDAIKANSLVYTRSNYIEETYKERVHGMNRINFYVKVGYLF